MDTIQTRLPDAYLLADGPALILQCASKAAHDLAHSLPNGLTGVFHLDPSDPEGPCSPLVVMEAAGLYVRPL